jgi:hypothetical protein|nr:MAG TPA: hypothetical protein [Caudoviricetes sp.]
MSKWFTQEGMETIMSLKGIGRIRLLFDEVFPNALPVENATYGRLNKNSSIAMLTIKVSDGVFVQAEGDDSDLITICGINFNWTFFRFNINSELISLSKHEQEAIRNLWAYTGALMKAYSLILAHHQAIGYDALDRIHRVLMIVGQVLRSYLNLNSVKQEAHAEFKKLTNRWSVRDLCLFESILGRYVIDNEGIAMREIYPERTVTVLVDIKKHAVDENIIVIEDHASGNKPIVKVVDLKVSYTYINCQLSDLIEKYGLDASKVMVPLASITKGMLLCHLFQDIDRVGKHDGLNTIKNKMVRHFACGHLDIIKPTLVHISEKASRLVTEITP